MLGIPRLLLVDDDTGLDIDTFYAKSLSDVGQSFERWDVSTQGSPATALANYDYAVWFTGDTRPTPMSETDVAGLIGFLGNGGRLLITSQDFVQLLSERSSIHDTILLHQYLKVGYSSLQTSTTNWGSAAHCSIA